ncbi:MAG: hypothetical protein QMB62_07875 [Oscillospiraceae bacterium]
MEYIKDIALALILAIGCAILANILKSRKEYILGIVSGLVQKAEAAVQGSGMGAEKKALVLAQLEAMDITVTAWLSKAIDEIVAQLNEKRAWLTENAKDGLGETTGT